MNKFSFVVLHGREILAELVKNSKPHIDFNPLFLDHPSESDSLFELFNATIKHILNHFDAEFLP
jgi:hypothetical protein